MIVHKSPGSSSSSELSKVILPTCIPYGHSSTKWLLNTFRNSANKRLLAMVKERPHMFRHTFQIFDRPSEVMADPTDTKPLFNNMAVLYLKPLSLAIYMRCRSAVEILLESTLCNPMECSYASDVHVQVQGHSGGDLLELLPACIAVRRQFLEVLPILFQSTAVSRCAPCSPRTSFALNYVSKRVQRSNVYDDIFQYVTEIAQFNRHINIVRTLDVLISRCPGFYVPGHLDENRKTELHSLFRRLLHVALFVDTDNRICFPLIQCMDLLVRYSHFQPDAPFGTSESLSTFTMTFNKVQESWAKLTGWIKDCYICVTLLFQLYAVLLIKAKSNAIGHAGNLLFRVLIEINCFDVVNTMAVDDFAKTLDFILKQDVVGRKLQQDRKTLSPQRSRATGERGDCRGAFFSFLRSQDSLILVLDKLKARFKLAQLRRMHILCLARSNRLGFDGNHVPRRYAVTRYDPITSGRSMAYTLRHQCMGDLHRYGKFEKQSSASLVTESDPRGSSSNTTNPRNNALKYMNKSELSDCHVHLGVPSINPTVRDRSVIPNITTQNGNETEDAKCEDLDDRSPDSENDKSGPPSRIFPPMMHINGESECHSGMRPCHMTSEFDPNGSNIPCRPNSFTKPYSEIIRSVNEEAPHRFEESRRGDEKPRSYSTVRKIRGTEEIFNVSVFPKLRNENLSLRDVDQLIDCITTSALANEQDLESQLIEDFFRDYIDRCPTDFAGTSRAESPLETQTCSDGHNTASSVPLGQWPSPIMGNCVSPQRSADCITSMRTCGRPHSIDPKEGLPDSFKGSECLCTRSVNTNSQMPQDLETDGLNATSYRNFLWSCARPICHVNHAIETFKQKAATKRVTAHADTKTISPEELPKPYA